MSVDIVRHWRLKAQRYSLTGQTCPDCNQNIFPPRPVCPHCAETTAPVFPWNVEEITSSAHVVTEIPQVSRKKSAKIVAAATVQNGYERRQEAEVIAVKNRHTSAVYS